MGFAGRNSPLGWTGAVVALIAATSLARPEPERYEPGPIFLPDNFSGAGPIHRGGRFKRNQRKQRKGAK
jgi:hypothetical protein